eukprot:765504-Hanusia_phi.AAC.3
MLGLRGELGAQDEVLDRLLLEVVLGRHVVLFRVDLTHQRLPVHELGQRKPAGELGVRVLRLVGDGRGLLAQRHAGDEVAAGKSLQRDGRKDLRVDRAFGDEAHGLRRQVMHKTRRESRSKKEGEISW